MTSLPPVCLLWTLAVVLCTLPSLAHGKRTVRAIYILGDSLVDVGNNNHLRLSIIKADFPHNGIDFPGGKATGRFSNGKNAADFIAQNVGLATSPPYLSLARSPNRTRTFLTGVNFASGGAGISDATARDLEQSIPLNKQIAHFLEVQQALVQQLGLEKAGVHLARSSLFVVVIGSNDIFGYLKSLSRGWLRSTPQEFVDSLLPTLEGQLQRIYDMGARKLLFVGTGALGCCPSHRAENSTGDCNEVANDVSLKYNEGVFRLLQKLKAELDGLRYSFFDTYKAVMEYIQNPLRYGFVEAKAACCGLGTLNAKAACLPISFYCSNRKAHIFWDFHHPTETTYQMLTEKIFGGSKEYVHPINARQLTRLSD